ncbi:MAG: hypothetical protein ACRD2J_12400 [Thermoanaerobaculia bacterium]
MNKIAACLCVMFPALLLASGDPGLLEAANPNREAPVWVPAATLRDNVARKSSLFEPHELRILALHEERSRAREEAATRCDETNSLVVFDAVPDRRSSVFREMVASAEDVYVVRVIGASDGFYDGLPASLLHVRVLETWRFSGKFNPNRPTYIVYPDASFAIGELSYCRKDHRYPARPESGSRLIIFRYDSLTDRQRQIIQPHPWELFPVTSSGELAIPTTMTADPSLASVETIEDLRSIVEKSR